LQHAGFVVMTSRAVLLILVLLFSLPVPFQAPERCKRYSLT
jgi:hypothetical protein